MTKSSLSAAFRSLALLLLVGCGSGPRNSQRFVKESGFSADPLHYTAVSRTLLTARSYFVSYSPSSGRLGVIDAGDFREVWGTYLAPSIPFVFNLPGYEGAGFIDAGTFTVVVREGIKTFSVPGIERQSWNRARSTIAVAGYSSSSRHVHVVRYRGENKWEESEIDAFETHVGITDGRVVVSDHGAMILVADAASGSYAVVADRGGTYELRHTCPFSTPLNLSGAVIDERSGHAYVASGGKILRIDLSAGAGCQSPEAWAEVANTTRSFTDIGLLDSDTIYATERDASVATAASKDSVIHILTRGGALLSPGRTFGAGCIEPTGVNSFGSSGVVVTCVNRADGLMETFIQNVTLQFFSARDELLFNRTIEFERMAGVVFNSESSEFYEVLDSAAGEVRVTNVVTGSSRHVGGIYLDGILNKL